MAWEIEIDGQVLQEKFGTEEEANQFAANKRGQDWSKKIIVRQEGSATKTDAAPKQQQPADMLGAADLLSQQQKTQQQQKK